MEKNLLLTTKNEILERMMLKTASYYDPVVLRAIEKYLDQSSVYSQASHFINELSPVFQKKEKESYINVFKEYMEIEAGIEVYSTKYVSHIDHVIQEFLIGYNILHTNKIVLKEYSYSQQKEEKNSDFNNLLFSWMVGSLFHDIGYDIERYEEEEQFRKKKNSYWNFLTSRPVVDDSIQLNINSEIVPIIEEKLLKKFNEYFGTIYCYTKFISLFKYKNSYDHAFISGLKYLEQLYHLEKENGGNYLSWSPNYDAIFSMLLHNFKHKEESIKLCFSKRTDLLPYLLIVCDEIEYWERKRILESTNNEIDSSIELSNASYKSSYSYFIVNHVVNTKKLKKYKDKLFENILDCNDKYPVNIIYSELLSKIDDDINTKFSDSTKRESIVYLFEGKYRNFNKITNEEAFKFLKLSAEKKKLREKIEYMGKNTKMLVPSMEYKVIVEHRINDKQFLLTEFLL